MEEFGSFQNGATLTDLPAYVGIMEGPLVATHKKGLLREKERSCGDNGLGSSKAIC